MLNGSLMQFGPLTPGGSSGSIQFNDNGVFGGFGTFNSGTGTVTIPYDLDINDNYLTGLGAIAYQSSGFLVKSANLTDVASFGASNTANSLFYGVVKIQNGTAAAPSIAFDSDTDTGFYRFTTNYLGFTAGGKQTVAMGTATNGDSKWQTERDFYILPGNAASYNGYEVIIGDPTLVSQTGFSCLSSSTTSGYAQFSFRLTSSLTIGTALKADYSFGQTLWAVNDPNGNQMVYCYSPYLTKDFDHPLATDTEIYVQASVNPDTTNNLWGMFRHNRTDFQIYTGAATGAGTSPSTVTNDIVLSPRSTEQLRVSTSSNAISVAGWVTKKQNSVAAANDFTATSDSIYVTGATQINRIAPPPYSSTHSTHLTLIFASNPVVKHNQATGGGFNAILLAGSADFSTAANSVLCLAWDSVNSVWQEISRKSA